MNKKITKKQIEALELEKYRLTVSLVFIGFVLFFGIIAINLKAATITHKFKNPSFSGIGTSSHYLTIENQEFNRKMSIKEELKAIQDQIERDVEHDRAMIESGASIEVILQELMSTLKVNLKALKEIEREYNKTS